MIPLESQPVQFIGGPMHNKWNVLPEGQTRVHIQAYWRNWVRDEALQMTVPTDCIHDHTYYVQEYRESMQNPLRYRSVWVAMWESGDILPHEIDELNWRLQHMHWTVSGASMFEDFDQWMAEKIHRETGWLWWQGRRLDAPM